VINVDDDTKKSNDLTRRQFVKYFAGTTTYMSFASFGLPGPVFLLTRSKQRYPIDSTVKTTAERMISFPFALADPAPNLLPSGQDPPLSPNGSPGLRITELYKVPEYDSKGYGKWEYVDWPLPIKQRTDIMPTSFNPALVTKKTKLLNFFAMTDIHITDKEAPNSFIYLQQQDQLNSGGNTSIYSPIMMYTTHVFDAAIQTANALHKKNSFDFFISLGDTCNCTSYNELRWYIDVIDGKVITPSSGAHLGAQTIDYQKPFQAVGLDKSIPFYQAIGNHDHFLLGSFPPYETGLADSFLSDTVWSVPDFLVPDGSTFPAMFSVEKMKDDTPRFYAGVIDGSTPYGSIINYGSVDGPHPPQTKVAADPNRRSLLRTEWIQEFFKTATSPVGHGFNLVSSNPNFNPVPENDKAGFACYSFVPKSNIPLKVIVLDDTQREDDGSVDIHGHGFLDAARWAWLQAELAQGQAANQLMIIAAHIPIAVVNIAAETEWWLGGNKSASEPKPLGDASTDTQNAVDLAGLVQKLWETPNLLMWIAGHRHLNTVKAFKSPTLYDTTPESGFWQVETSSLHDFPQQFRTFEIYLNSDYSISIETVNVDPAVAVGSPAETSRKYAIAAQQIVQQNLTVNSVNFEFQPEPGHPDIPIVPNIPLPSIDPSRPDPAQGTPGADGAEPTFTDPTIKYVDMTTYGVPYNASYNAQLFKQLSPTMKAKMIELFPSL
jgi:metallophosphoesterase (TIGR03768 family)